MAALQDALQCLAPVTWDSIPTDPDKLRSYIHDISSKARLIVDSVPEPLPSHSHTRYAVDPSSPAASRLAPSPARTRSTDPETTSLYKHWGKPIKISSVKDNPLEIPIYKVQGSNGKGAWFGRRSVHAGLPFSRWKEKLASEMDETLRANEARMRKGHIADQAVRGIGAERLLERVEVKDEQGLKTLGTVNVYHVSAQFPKPTTPRDFVTLIIDWETEVNGVDAEIGTANNGAEARRRGRNWMMVSKPCEHPDAPPNQGYIRGQYESVEFIREIPVSKPPGKDVPHGKALSPVCSEDNLLRGGVLVEATQQKGALDEKVGRKRGNTGSAAQEKQNENTDGHDDQPDDEDSYPVEWIMVTRSDPGGSIPRWMVEKGTPKSICTDSVKFLDWACRDSDGPGKDKREDHRQLSSGKPLDGSSMDGRAHESTDSESGYTEYEEEEHHGLIASFSYLLNAGLERYAPKAVLDYLPQHTRESSAQYSSSDETDAPSEKVSSSDISRAKGKGGTENLEKTPDLPAADAASQTSQAVSLPNSVPTTPLLEIAENIPSLEMMNMNKKGKLSSHEKQLVKLAQRKREVEAQLDNVRNEIQTLRLESPNDIDPKKAKVIAAAAGGDSGASDQASTASSDQKPIVDGTPTPSDPSRRHKNKGNSDTAHLHKIASGLFQQESKLLKQLGKIEKHQLKEASKIEVQQRKHAEREEKTRSRAETDGLRQEVETLKKEIERLRTERQKWLDLVASLQAENTKLAAQQKGNAESH
ncbi:uncharacterized protein ACLA_028910 [Aspergillus clavatus NRRL 1]|uniref:DUF3074 domain-containing protein n=1 Tax=Aspergillus clavatus (strain ATCC 1007 / CBS 513.65 / DSM 816 / NCTC 3887 / NRRL 1 / QM 1276 / 107) TaxID=344612 RepID=A1CR94_ASPCL|nr:uncharacterized protein ACLA_028910 [Aspergillus clavatus NRRL 1]EAW08165.1 conserved hypothetical protein [Aspergillus clavatus NRRL 1]